MPVIPRQLGMNPGQFMPPINFNPELRNLLQVQRQWYIANAGQTFGIGANLRAPIINNLTEVGNRIPPQRLNGLNDNQQQLRRLFHGAWNNNGGNIKHISTQELVAIYHQGRQAYTDAEGNINENRFREDFFNMFRRSVSEDTTFNPNLIAYQMTMALSATDFHGNDAVALTNFFSNMHERLYANLNLPQGRVISYTNPGFRTVRTTIGPNGVPQVVITPPVNPNLKRFDLNSNDAGNPQNPVFPLFGN